MSIEIPINVNMEVEESQMAFNMSVDEEIDVTVIQGTDVSDTTAVEADVLAGKKFHKADGSLATGTLPVYYTKLCEDDLTVSTTNTSAASAGSFYVDVPADLWTSAKIIYVSIRDKAGKRNGYFYGSDAWFVNAHPVNASASTSYSAPSRYRYTYSSDGVWAASNSTTAYGLYAYDINSSGRVRIYSRYSASDSLTINGTYHVEVYALSWPDSSPLS